MPRRIQSPEVKHFVDPDQRTVEQELVACNLIPDRPNIADAGQWLKGKRRSSPTKQMRITKSRLSFSEDFVARAEKEPAGRVAVKVATYRGVKVILLKPDPEGYKISRQRRMGSAGSAALSTKLQAQGAALGHYEIIVVPGGYMAVPEGSGL